MKDETFNKYFNDLVKLVFGTTTESDYMLEHNDGFSNLIIPAPGYTKEDIEIQVHGNSIKIEGNPKSKYAKPIAKEFTISMSKIDIEKSNAVVENGILIITFPHIKKDVTNIKVN